MPNRGHVVLGAARRPPWHQQAESTAPQISIQPRDSSRTVRTHRWANALAFGAGTGVAMIWVLSEANIASKSG